MQASTDVPDSILRVTATPKADGYAIRLTNIGSRPIEAFVMQSPDPNARPTRYGAVDRRQDPLAPGDSMDYTSSIRPSVAAIILDGGYVIGTAVGTITVGASSQTIDFVQVIFDNPAAQAAAWDQLVKAINPGELAASFLTLVAELPAGAAVAIEAKARASQLEVEIANLPKDTVDRTLMAWLTDRVTRAHQSARRSN